MSRPRALKRDSALRDLAEVADYIVENTGLDQGLRFLAAAEETFDMLARNPEVGSPRFFRSQRLLGVRSFPVTGFPNHIVFYLSAKEGVRILRLLHGSRDGFEALLLDER